MASTNQPPTSAPATPTITVHSLSINSSAATGISNYATAPPSPQQLHPSHALAPVPSHSSSASSSTAAASLALARALPPGDPVSEGTSDVDSVWNLDFQEVWEQRQRDDIVAAAAAATLKERSGHSKLAMGFAITPGSGGMSRRPSRNPPVQTRSAVSSAFNSKAPSRALSRAPSHLGTAGQHTVRIDLDQLEHDAGLAPHSIEDSAACRGKMWSWVNHNRRRMRRFMRLQRFHLVMIALVAFDLVIVMVELIVALLTAGCTTERVYEILEMTIEHSQTPLKLSELACTLTPSMSRDVLENSIFALNISLLSIFTIDVFFALFAFGPITYCSSWVTLLDGGVVLATLCLDVYFNVSDSPNAKSPIALVILRLWKVFRAVHAIAHALELHYEEVLATAEEGARKLEVERVAESIRLRYVRNALIKASGADVDPRLVEEEVQRELRELERKAAEEAAIAAHAAHRLGNLHSRSHHNHH